VLATGIMREAKSWQHAGRWRPGPGASTLPSPFLLLRRAPVAAARKAADEDELCHALRVAHGISDGDRATLQLAQQSEAVHADGIGTKQLRLTKLRGCGNASNRYASGALRSRLTVVIRLERVIPELPLGINSAGSIVRVALHRLRGKPS
jgi:hypothetical protein